MNLETKLGVSSGQRIIVRRCPEDFHAEFKRLGAAFDRGTIAEITLSFVTAQSEIDNAAKEAIALTAPGGIVWMAYPVETETLDWGPFARAGWQPVSEISLDEQWIALRFRPE